MSILLLFLAAVNLPVRAGIDVKKSNKKTEGKGQSEKDQQQDESKESITELDFFSAFSLVNIQLQWRDLHVGQQNDLNDLESTSQSKGLSFDEVSNWNWEDEAQHAPSNAFVPAEDALFIWITQHNALTRSSLFCSQNNQLVSTIAYIQNCGTYPQIS